MHIPLPLLNHPGAVPPPEDHAEQHVPWHWGDPFAEQRAAQHGAVVVDRSHRQILTVRGKERLSWLHLVLSQHVTELPEHVGTQALILDSQGHIDLHLELAHHDGGVWLDTDPNAQATSALPGGGKQSLPDYLEAMKFWADVQIADHTSDFAMLSILGPAARDVLSTVDNRVGSALGRGYAVTSLTPPADGFARQRGHGYAGIDVVVPRSELTDWWQRIVTAGARPAGSWAYDALRVESRFPQVGVDTDERTLPHEVNWVDSAVHVAKGCYRGQETVSKIHHVGRPPRRMLLLHLDGSPEILPETGNPVSWNDQTVGRVGSVVQHHELGPIALALIKRSVPVTAELYAGNSGRGVQAAIDPDSVPAEHHGRGREAVKQLRENSSAAASNEL